MHNLEISIVSSLGLSKEEHKLKECNEVEKCHVLGAILGSLSHILIQVTWSGVNTTGSLDFHQSLQINSEDRGPQLSLRCCWIVKVSPATALC